MEDIGGRRFKALNATSEGEDCRLNTNHYRKDSKVFYYDCLAPKRQGESDEDYVQRCAVLEAHFDMLRMVDNWHVFLGQIKGVGKKARQKQIDIQIAVDLLTHTHRRNIRELEFIAGNQDFIPVVDAIVRDGMYVRLLYERMSASKDLLMAADAKWPPNCGHIKQIERTQLLRNVTRYMEGTFSTTTQT